MKLKYLIILLLSAGIISASEGRKAKVALEPVTEAVAGETLVLNFENADENSRLILKNSYGQTILKPEKSSEENIFTVPEFLAKKAGILSWKFINGNSIEAGEIQINPKEEPHNIETYFGPRSIQAGNTDYSMLVNIPVDKFDNPLADGTAVEVSEYFNGNQKTENIKMQNLFAWKNIYSREKAGNILVGASCKDLQTGEMTSTIYPSTATDFEVYISREHDFADGNQVMSLKTSILKDKFGNTVSDGTLVDFVIANAGNNILKTSAGTIDGVASAKILHPEKAENWQIRAVVTGMAESGIIAVNFKPVMEDFKVNYDRENRKIKVGPLKSFLGQLIADGATVSLETLNGAQGKTLEMQEPSKDGYVNFELPPTVNYPDSTIFKIEALGITKTIK